MDNAGPDDATEIEFEDRLPDGLTYVSAIGEEWTCSSSDGVQVACERDRLDVGDSTTITLEVEVGNAVEGSVVNTASVSSTESERDLSNNTDSAETTISQQSQPPSPLPATPPAASPPAATPNSFLASTGAQVGGIMLFGLGLGIIGVLFLAASKRRREDSTD